MATFSPWKTFGTNKGDVGNFLLVCLDGKLSVGYQDFMRNMKAI